MLKANRFPMPNKSSLAALFVLVAVQSAQSDEIPVVKFTDITTQAGISFTHNNGATGDKLLPETMGGGVAFLDFDNDGAPDLLFINSADWPSNKQSAMMALFHNNGHGKFADVTTGSGLDVSFYGMGVA